MYKETFLNLCHGTDEISAEKIIKDGFKLSGDAKSWCGAGVYFYDIKAKAWWSANRTCTRLKNVTGEKLNPCVVYADIKNMPIEDIFDMRTERGMSLFENAIKPMLEKESGVLKISDIDSEVDRIIELRQMLIDFYVTKNGIKLIIGIFRQRPNPEYNHYIELADTLYMVFGVETIYCVKDTSILSNIHLGEK